MQASNMIECLIPRRSSQLSFTWDENTIFFMTQLKCSAFYQHTRDINHKRTTYDYGMSRSSRLIPAIVANKTPLQTSACCEMGEQRICLLSRNKLVHMCSLTGKYRKYLYSVCWHPLHDTPGLARLQTRPDQTITSCDAMQDMPHPKLIELIGYVFMFVYGYKYLHSLRFEDKFPPLTSSQCGSLTKRLSNNNMLIMFICALRCDYVIFFKDKVVTFMTFLSI